MGFIFSFAAETHKAFLVGPMCNGVTPPCDPNLHKSEAAKGSLYKMRFLRLATFDSFLRPRPVSIFMRHLQLRCKVSDTVSQVLLASPSTAMIWRSSRIAQLCGIPRVDATSWLHISSILHPKVQQKSTAAKPCKNMVFQKIWRFFFDGLLATTWRSLGSHKLMVFPRPWRFSLLAVIFRLWRFRHSSLLRNHLFENHSWPGLLVKEIGPPRRHDSKTMHRMERKQT